MRNYTFIFFRAGGILALALLAFLLPAVGENRILLAAILAFVAMPLAVFIELRYPVAETGWSEPLFDLSLIVILVHLIPEAWHLALLVGTLLLGATGIVASRIGYRFYILLMAVLVFGMSFAGYAHNVEGWSPAILVVLVILPTISFYVYEEHGRIQELNQQQKALENLSLLAGGVAHDFNNMLTTIRGNTELALLDLSADHPSRETLAAALDGTKRASLLSGQLLAFSGRKIDKKTVLDLRTELRIIVGLMESVVPKGVLFAMDLTEEPCFIECDQAQIQQVIMNIIFNAGEATSNVPSTISLSLTHETSSKPLIILEICDQGIGIHPELLKTVFQPFVTSKPTGHGLGLASAKRVVEEHKGEITIKSQENVGTCVRLSLPLTSRSIPTKTIEKAREFSHEGLIMVVDDEPQIRKLASLFLQRLGYLTVEAKDGEEAISLFSQRSNEFTAILLDLKMPGIDGWECLRELREIRTDIPVIISSGYNPADAQGDIRSQTFLAKPYSFKEMDRIFRLTLS